MNDLSKERLVAALRTTWDSLLDLCRSLDTGEWDAPTDCPGWTVRDHVAHIIGTESMLAGRDRPDVEVPPSDHVHNEIGELNEVWVQAYRLRPVGDVVADLDAITTARAAELEAMTPEDFAADSWTPAGQSTYGRFMRIRVFDCWLHEQDIRRPLDRPGALDGPAAELALDEVVAAMGYVVGKRGAAPEGSVVVLDITGPTARTVNVQVDGRAAVVDEPSRPVTATVRLPLRHFMALAGGRIEAAPLLEAGTIELEGDAELGRRVASNLAFTI